MFFFKKKEAIGIGIILVVLFVITKINYGISAKRARDYQRLMDISKIQEALISYKEDYGNFPASSTDGKITACRGEFTDYDRNPDRTVKSTGEFRNKIVNMVPCIWGKDWFGDVVNGNYLKYLEVLPADPQSQSGISYLYISNQEEFQLLTSFELKNEYYDKSLVKRKINCGGRICNSGKTSLSTSLEKVLVKEQN